MSTTLIWQMFKSIDLQQQSTQRTSQQQILLQVSKQPSGMYDAEAGDMSRAPFARQLVASLNDHLMKPTRAYKSPRVIMTLWFRKND